MIPYARRQEIITEIEKVRPSIVEKLVEQMYADPFWEEKYGVLGKNHARQDVNYHLDNLITAIRVEIVSSPTHHYRYLQNVLVHRGISTLHIRQTLDLLKRLLKDALPDYWRDIEPYLDAGYDGLAYENTASKSLSEKEEAIAIAAAERLPLFFEGFDPESEASWRKARRIDNLLFLSYLQDAVEKQSPEIFEDYARWSLSFLPRHGVPIEIVKQEWKLLAEEISAHMEPEGAKPFIELLERVSI